MKAYIELNDISFGYKKTGFSIKDISLKLYGGQAVVLTGGNGSGKTTLSKLMVGIFKPERGSVIIKGQDIRKTSLSENAKSIGYLFQNPERHFFCASALEEIKFSLKHKGASDDDADARAYELLGRFSMLERAQDFPLKLSRGEKQRLALLAVIAMRPQYYILDEPSSGIDEDNKQKLIDMLCQIKREGAGLCIITHDTALARSIADRVITMSGGMVISDESA